MVTFQVADKIHNAIGDDEAVVLGQPKIMPKSREKVGETLRFVVYQEARIPRFGINDRRQGFRVMEPASPANAPQPPAAIVPAVKAWPRSAQIVVAFLCGIVVTLLSVQLRSLFPGYTKPTALQHSADMAYRIHLNRADRAELLQLPGVGEGLSGRLEQYRHDHGAFEELDQLRHVKGIGPARLAQLSDWVTVEQDGVDRTFMDDRSVLSPLKKDTSKAAAKKTPKGSDIAEPIDINRASATELQRIPGVGPTTARRIIDTRTKAPFETVEDLRRVPRLGAKTLDKLRPYVTVSRLPSH